MLLDRVVRSIPRAAVCILATVVAQLAAAEGVAHTMSPHIIVGPRAAQVPNALGPPFFTCQLAGAGPQVCYDPFQIRRAYQIDALMSRGFNGSGRTIAIIDAFQSPTLPQDLDGFDQLFDLPRRIDFFTQIAPYGLTPFDPTNADMVGWSAEISLDVEWAHAIAPAANVVLVLAASDADTDILNAIQYAVSHHLGDIISMSFGENESCVDPASLLAYHQLFVEATQKNITLIASSGDDGAAGMTCDGNSWTQAVNQPASDPLVTGIGGTELHAAGYCLRSQGCNPAVNPLPGTYQGELVWNNDLCDPTGASGGGFSVLFQEPLFQLPIRTGGVTRGVPDVAYSSAVCHGVLVDWGGAWYLFGGTSAGSPQWSAITAIADQKAERALGFLNFGLYRIGGKQHLASVAFNDILVGDNSVVEFDVNDNPVPITGFNAGPGWDATTGFGTPIGLALVNELVAFTLFSDGMTAIQTTSVFITAPAKASGQMRPH